MSTLRQAWIARLLVIVVAGLAGLLVALPTSSSSAAVTYRILITGDSITQGSSGDYTWRYRLWNKLASTAPGATSLVGTRTDLYDNVNDAFGSQYYAASFASKSHAAQWGDAFVHELPHIASQVSISGANVLVVALGSNDLTFFTSPADTIANLRTYIQRARTAAPGIDVVVGEVVNRYDPWAATYVLNAEANDYAARLATLAKQMNTSSQRVVTARTRTGWDAKIHTWDGTHPNPTGEKVLAQRISEGLAKIGVGSSSPSILGTTAWGVAGPTPTLTPGPEEVAIAWDRTPSGATGMFIEQRRSDTNVAWQRLPYAVGGDGWTSTQLDANSPYEFRLVPSKGWNTGVAGPSATATTTGYGQ